MYGLGGMLGAALGQSIAASQASESTGQPASEARQAERRARDVEARLEKLTLICMAMWSLIQEKTNLTEEELIERVKQIDLLDGKEDGRVTPQVARCSSCGRVMNARHTKCLYCGHEKLVITAFDAVT